MHFDGRFLTVRRGQAPLGADDTVGVFLMIEMVRRRVPGIYVWHAGEEMGCIGSRALADARPDWLNTVKAVIALDRRGTSDVITHQCGSRTASQAFALALAAQLRAADPDLQYSPSANGSFTDSDSYTSIVPECTNLSVGYYHEHTSNEVLDVPFVLRLLDALCDLDTASLPIERDPAVREPNMLYFPAQRDEYDDRWLHEWAYGKHSRLEPCQYLDPEFEAVQRSLDVRMYLGGYELNDDAIICPACAEILLHDSDEVIPLLGVQGEYLHELCEACGTPIVATARVDDDCVPVNQMPAYQNDRVH